MVFTPELEKHKHYEDAHHYACFIFPKNFLWGAATSSHQVEGNNENDWTEFEKQKGNIRDGSVSGIGVNHYEYYKKDFNLAKNLGQNSHRLSIEWSRIQPERGKFSESEIQHYREVLQDLKSKGFTVMLTLNHFTLPKWFSDRGGWLHSKAVRDFVNFANRVFDEYKNQVDLWITINEPNIYATQSYAYGNWPPKVKSSLKTIRVFLKLAKAHKVIYKNYHHKKSDAKVGFANNVVSIESYNKHSYVDFLYLYVSGWFLNHAFYKISGRKNHDFIGLNYYVHQRVKRKGLRFVKFIDNRSESREHSDMGWEIYPNGIYQIIFDMIGYKKPIYITENGIAADNDRKRMRYIVAYLRQIYHAISQGADVRGYFHWSLLDNFEWSEGYKMRFGLISVDHKTQERTIKDSARLYGDIASRNSLCHEFFKVLGHEVEYKNISKG